MTRRLASLVFIVMVGAQWAASAAAQDAPPTPDLKLTIDRSTITVGDPIELTIDVAADTSWEVSFGPPTGEIGSFAVLNDTTVVAAASADSRRWTRRLRLTAFAPGDFSLPSIPVAYGDSMTGEAGLLKTEPLDITVTSVFAQAGEDTLDIRDIKRPHRLRSTLGIWGWIAVAQIVVALVILVLVARGKLRFRRRYDTVRTPTPWEIAREELDTLRRLVDPTDENGRRWYYGLSQILRRFLDGRLHWETLDMTTTEIGPVLMDSPFEERTRNDILEFFQRADRAKFARRRNPRESALRDWAWIAALVDWATPKPEGAPGEHMIDVRPLAPTGTDG